MSSTKEGDVESPTLKECYYGVSFEQLCKANEEKDGELLVKIGGHEGLARALRTDLHSGLDTSREQDGSLEDRAVVFGSNSYKATPPKNFFVLVWEVLQDPIVILLCIAAGISTILGAAIPEERAENHWIEGVAIWIAVLIVTLVGAGNDYSKDLQFRKLNAKKDDISVKVLRNGRKELVPNTSIVVGDLLLLDTGDKICADGIVVDSYGLTIDEASLTGESDPIRKSRDSEIWIRSGTQVTEGSGSMLVIAVGEQSEWGRTLALVTTAGGEDTPLQEKLEGLAGAIGKVGIAVAVVCFIAELIKWCVDNKGFPIKRINENGPVQFLLYSITIVVVAVPEGLPLAVTISLAYSMKKMMKDNNFVRVLAACETMGGATAICSDKTGTLTENRMTVVEGWFAGKEFRGRVAAPEELPEGVVEKIAVNCALNSKAFLLPLNKKASGPAGAESKKKGKSTLFSSVWPFGKASSKDQELHTRDGGNDGGSSKKGGENNSATDEQAANSGGVEFVGNRTECALLLLLEREWRASPVVGGYERVRNAHEANIVQLYGFSSAKKMASVLMRDPTDPGKLVLYNKGAAEWVIQRCSHYVETVSAPLPLPLPLPAAASEATIDLVYGQGHGVGLSSSRDASAAYLSSSSSSSPPSSSAAVRVPMTPEKREELLRFVTAMAKRGLRCICLTYKEIPADDPGRPKDFFENSDNLDQDLTALAIVGIKDPVRKEVPDAVRTCQRAGIVVRMVTGDNIFTARHIARECGILDDEEDHHANSLYTGAAMPTKNGEVNRVKGVNNNGVVRNAEEGSAKGVAMTNNDDTGLDGDMKKKTVATAAGNAVEESEGHCNKKPAGGDGAGSALVKGPKSLVGSTTAGGHETEQGFLAMEGPVFRSMPVEQLIPLLPRLRVLARSSPEDKLTLVRLLKQQGEVVAVTGDGTNDAPALKESDVGLAMGIAGTEVAKEAADIVIMDDNFRSIVKSVLWGRSVFANIRKFLMFQLTVNLVALVTAFIGAVVGGHEPLNVLQLLWVNLIMDTMGALALATEDPTPALLRQKPNDRTERLINKRMLKHILVQGSYQLFWMLLCLYYLPTGRIAPGRYRVHGKSWFYANECESKAGDAVTWFRDNGDSAVAGSGILASAVAAALANSTQEPASALATPTQLACNAVGHCGFPYGSADNASCTLDLFRTATTPGLVAMYDASASQDVNQQTWSLFAIFCNVLPSNAATASEGCQQFVKHVQSLSSSLGERTFNKYEDDAYRRPLSVLFNIFIFCQVANEINARRINDELNPFEGLASNYIFMGIILITVGLQAIIINFLGMFFKVEPLEWDEWLISIAIGFGAWPLSILTRFISRALHKRRARKGGKGSRRFNIHGDKNAQDGSDDDESSDGDEASVDAATRKEDKGGPGSKGASSNGAPEISFGSCPATTKNGRQDDAKDLSPAGEALSGSYSDWGAVKKGAEIPDPEVGIKLEAPEGRKPEDNTSHNKSRFSSASSSPEPAGAEETKASLFLVEDSTPKGSRDPKSF